MKCYLCQADISEERVNSARRYKNHWRRYCSQLCVKRAWHMRNKFVVVSTLLSGANLDSATGKGLYWEIHAQKILGGKVLSLEVMNQPFDILLDSGETVDVKSSNIHLRSGYQTGGWWAFHREGENSPDFYFCIGLRENRPERYFLIPSRAMAVSGISVPISPKRSKYYQYEYKT